MQNQKIKRRRKGTMNQIDKIAYEAMELLVSQMNEQKKRKPKPQSDIIHKMITPILIRRDTTS